MKRKHLPAWQQVLLVVLNGTFSAKNGNEAWGKLKDEEKAAVTDFLTEHCGHLRHRQTEQAIGGPGEPPGRCRGCGDLLCLEAGFRLAFIH